MNLTPDDLIEALQVVQGWHARNMGIIDSMIGSASEAVQLIHGAKLLTPEQKQKIFS